MFSSPLLALQALAPLADPRLSDTDLATWDPGVADLLKDAGFLVGGGSTSDAMCASCGDVHRFERLPRNPAQFAAACPDAGMVIRDAAALQEWTIAHAAVASWIGSQVGATGAPDEVLPGQAWRWDRVQFAGTRRALIVVRSLPTRTGDDVWRHLNLVPRAMLVSLGTKPLVPEEHGPVAFVAPIWSYLDEDDQGIHLLTDELVADVTATDAGHAVEVRPVAGKRATRERILGILRKEIVAHLQSAKDALRQNLPLLPRPEQQLLARLAETSEATISRCFTDDTSPQGRAVQRLWAMALDEHAVRTFDANTAQ